MIDPNVVGALRGYKFRGGLVARYPDGKPIPCISVHVRRKLAPNLVEKAFMIPAELDGLATDVIQPSHPPPPLVMRVA